jgi:tetratricopeptide (TPR) repeat protein
MSFSKPKYRNYMRSFLVLASLILLVSRLEAQSLELKVVVPKGVLHNGDQLQVRGEGIPGGWESGTVMTLHRDGIHKVSVSNPVKAYKYTVVRSDGTVVWEPGYDRVFSDAIDTLRGFEGPLLTGPTVLVFELDLTGLSIHGYPPDSVRIYGPSKPLDWGFPGNGLFLSDFQVPGVWNRVVTLYAGSPVDVAFKFGWLAEGVWHWEYLPGHINHVAVMDPDSRHVRLQLRYDPQTAHVVAVAAEGAVLNDYHKAYSIYSGTRSYGYDLAITRLLRGELSSARATYEAFQRGFNGPVEVDDFDYLWAHQLADQGNLEAALAYSAQKGTEEKDPHRRAYFEYLQGELLANDGQHVRARTHLRRALAMPAASEDPIQMIQGYALMALGAGYLDEESPDSMLRARSPLLRLAHTHPDEQVRLIGWQLLEQAAVGLVDLELANLAAVGIAQTGTPEQRFRRQLSEIHRSVREQGPDQALERLIVLKNQTDNPRFVARADLMCVEVLMLAGRDEMARQNLETLSRSLPERGGRRRAVEMLRSLEIRLEKQ